MELLKLFAGDVNSGDSRLALRQSRDRYLAARRSAQRRLCRRAVSV